MQSKRLCGPLLFLLLSFLTGWLGSCRSGSFAKSPTLQAAQRADRAGHDSRAAELYKAHVTQSATDAHSRAAYASVLMRMGKQEEALVQFEQAFQTIKKPEADHYFYFAHSLHKAHRFKEAIDQYKNFLRKANKKDTKRNRAIADIRRAAVGLQWTHRKQDALVESSGTMVNTPFDELRPIISPNDPNRMYFSSNRRTDQWVPDPGADIWNMYSTKNESGAWQFPSVFLEKYKSSKNEILQSINANGSVLLFTQGWDNIDMALKADTFGISRGQAAILDAPVFPMMGDCDFFLYEDTVLIFSSLRKDGYGGYDLYFTIRSAEGWTNPENMGPIINGPFNERSPVLMENAAQLLFASDRLESMGGMDLFLATYDFNKKRWQQAENMGLPINSASDDWHPHPAQDGNTLYFSSDRAGGQGGYDIYQAVLRKPLEVATPFDLPFFMQGKKSLASKINATNAQEPPATPNRATPSSPTKTIEISPLFIEESSLSLTAEQKETLDKVAEVLLSSAVAKLTLSAHVHGSGNLNFNLFQSMLLLDKPIQYLIEKGVPSDRILSKGLGNQYPLAQEKIDGQQNTSAAGINRRVDIRLHRVPKLYQITYVAAAVPPFMQDRRAQRHSDLIEGLSYKVQFVSLRSMFSGALVDMIPDVSSERIGNAEIMQYNIGLFKTLSEALETRQLVAENGFKDAFIVVYIDGLKIARSEISEELQTRFPDLINYLKYTE